MTRARQFTLSAAELQRVSALLLRETGMAFGEAKRYYIERRIAARVSDTGAATPDAYLALVAASPFEREAFINAFTVNETYFYREENQLACLSRSLLPEIIRSRRPGDKIRIWSAPCSTGEEPYSIAMWLLENWRLVDAYNIEIIGSDIDTEAIRAAQAGLYGTRATARLPPAVLAAYFGPQRDGQYEIIRDIQESVTFTTANLVDGPGLAAQGQFDVIFCRNMLIYFDEPSRGTVMRNLHDRLLPGGWLCLGHTETMAPAGEMFVTRRFPDGSVFQRREQPG